MQDKTIGIWGLSFKPNTDDIREAPSLKVVETLIMEGAHLQLYDPQAMQRMQQMFPEQPGRLVYCTSLYQACEGSHAVLLLTEWEEFRSVDLQRVAGLMELPTLLDGRNILDADKANSAGFEYISIGRSCPRATDEAAVPFNIPPSQWREHTETSWR